MKRVVLSGLLMITAALGVAGCQQAFAPRADEVGFSVRLPEGASQAEAAWRIFLEDMTRLSGLEIEPVFASDEEAQVTALRDDQVQAGLFSNTAALRAVDEAGAYVFARASDANTAEGYRSLILTRADSGLGVENLLACGGGLRLGLGKADSLPGSLAPLTYLFVPAKIDPDTCFIINRDERAAQMEALQAGRLDAVVSNSIALQRLAQSDPEAHKRLKVVWTSPVLPDPPLLLRQNLDPAVREKLRSFVLSYGTGEGPEADRQRGVLARLGLGAFQPADNSHLLPAQEMQAAQALIAARKAADPGAITRAEAELAGLTARRQASARPAQAPADPQPEP